MIALEAAAVSAVGALAGAPLAVWLSGVMADVLRDREVVPAEFRADPSPMPLAIAVLAGLAVTQLAVFAAARRAARTRAVEALRSAAADRRAVPRSRMIAGFVALGLASPLAVGSASGGGETAAGASFGLAMILLVGAALLAPLAVRPLARLAGAPATRLTRATGLLAQANTAASARRTASAAVPLMLAVTLGATLLSTQATKRDATLSATAARIQADQVLVPASGPGLPPSPAAGLPGVTAASPVLSTTVYAGPAAELAPVPALGVDAATIGQVMALRADLCGPGPGACSAGRTAGSLPGAPRRLHLPGPAGHHRPRQRDPPPPHPLNCCGNFRTDGRGCNPSGHTAFTCEPFRATASDAAKTRGGSGTSSPQPSSSSTSTTPAPHDRGPWPTLCGVVHCDAVPHADRVWSGHCESARHGVDIVACYDSFC
ncbi:hypothetical protein GCM10010191_20270 [Actinomadura vinacea]|uniref:FtsX-like permease family protein n=2 Tax=Actinomadura vinacea TaxID=115336 RepID=A0ABN3IQ71_9ACTN